MLLLLHFNDLDALLSSFSQAHARKVKVLAPKHKCQDWANHQTMSVKESVEEDNL